MPTIVLKRDIDLKDGQAGEFKLEPLPSYPCRVVIELKTDGSNDWTIMSGADLAGNPVSSPDEVGDFKHIGHSFGRISLRANDDASGTIKFTIICEDPELDEAAFKISIKINQQPAPEVWDDPPNWINRILGGIWKFFRRIYDRFTPDPRTKFAFYLIFGSLLALIAWLTFGWLVDLVNRIASWF